MASFSHHKGLIFHCVEPVPSYAAQIRERFLGNQSCILHEALLSDKRREHAPIYQVGGGGRMILPKARSLKGEHSRQTKEVHKFTSAQITGDELVSSIGSDANFIKIDCDGHDYFVLSGFIETIIRAKPFIQFEYCDFWLQHGAKLRDACRLLSKAGYSTFYIRNNHLQRFEYSSIRETYEYSNIAAIPSDTVGFEGKRVAI